MPGDSSGEVWLHRSKLITELRGLLSGDGPSPPLLVYGHKGTGKSAVVRDTVRVESERNGGRYAFADCAADKSEAGLLQSLLLQVLCVNPERRGDAHAFVRHVQGVAQFVSLLEVHLPYHNRGVVIVLDNADAILDYCPSLIPALLRFPSWFLELDPCTGRMKRVSRTVTTIMICRSVPFQIHPFTGGITAIPVHFPPYSKKQMIDILAHPDAFLSGVWTDEGGSPVEISVSEGRVSVFGPEWTLRGRGGGRTLTLTSRGCVKKDSVVWEDMHKWVVAPQASLNSMFSSSPLSWDKYYDVTNTARQPQIRRDGGSVKVVFSDNWVIKGSFEELDGKCSISLKCTLSVSDDFSRIEGDGLKLKKEPLFGYWVTKTAPQDPFLIGRHVSFDNSAFLACKHGFLVRSGKGVELRPRNGGEPLKGKCYKDKINFDGDVWKKLVISPEAFRNICSVMVDSLWDHCRDLSEFRTLLSSLDPSLHLLYKRGIPSQKTLISFFSCAQTVQCLYNSERRVVRAQPSESKSVLQLSFMAKYALCATFLASYNPPNQDKRLFTNQATKKRRRKVSQKTSHSLMITGPKSFTLERLLMIFNAILPEDEEKAYDPARVDDDSDSDTDTLMKSHSIFSSQLSESVLSQLLELHLVTDVSPQEDPLEMPRYICDVKVIIDPYISYRPPRRPPTQCRAHSYQKPRDFSATACVA